MQEALKIQEDLQDALKGIDLILDDDIDDGYQYFEHDLSSFHKMGRATVFFMKAVLGFEPKILKKAVNALEISLEALARDSKHAARMQLQTSSYRPGAEFDVGYGQNLIMLAILGFCAESIVTSAKSVLRLRKAFLIYNNLFHTEQFNKFLNSKEAEPRLLKPQNYKEKTDLFISTGISMAYGTMNLIMSLLPEKMMKIMNLFGYYGDRSLGLGCLWQATRYTNNLHGCVSFAALIQFYGNALMMCDLTDAWPAERCTETLEHVRSKYRHGSLWILHEAKLRGMQRDLDGAIASLDDLSRSRVPPMKQIQALVIFERALTCTFAGMLKEAARCYVELTKFNKWSHALYLYMAGACLIEAARRDPRDVAVRADASALIEKVDALLSVKPDKTIPFFPSSPRRVPMEIFVERHIKKWKARRREENPVSHEPLAAFAGPSPIREMIYIWNGFRRMNGRQLEYWLNSPSGQFCDGDERVSESVVCAVILRSLGRIEDALEVLKPEVVKSNRNLNHSWAKSFAYYEMAVLLYPQSEGLKFLKKASEAGESHELESRLTIRVQLAKRYYEMNIPT